jgi:small subunit ribosomal protein S1
MKQLQPDAWETFFRTHQIGDVVRGRVCRSAAFGVFVELLPGVEGLCHRSEIQPDRSRRRFGSSDSDEPSLAVGQELDFKVIKLNEAQKRIGLSVKALGEDDEQSRLGDYQRQAAVASTTVGDAIKQRKSEEKD